MKKLGLVLVFLIGSIASAFAACTSPAVMHDFPGTAFNMSLATNAGDGNCASNVTLVGTLPAYTAIPTFKIDQTTPGTTNLVALGANQSVNESQINGVVPLMGNGVTGTGSQRVTIASDNTAFSVNAAVSQATSSNLKAQVDPLTAASWGIGTSTQNSASATNGQLALGQFNTTPTTITTGNMSPFQMDNAGNLLVNIKAGAGSGGTAIADEAVFTQGTTSITPGGCLFINSYAALTTGHVGVLSCTSAGSLHTTVDNANANGRAVVANSSPVVPVAAASTTGNIAVNNTTAVVVKASAGTLFGVQLGGIGSAPAYLKIYNATSATCGSGTPVKRLIIPAASTAANGAGSNVSFGAGLAFATGITYCITTGITDADTTAPAASTFLVNLDYE